jgi:mannose-6-phosphate isomerase-like protein (cupin superfamily)
MNVTRFGNAPEYHPPDHEGMKCLRLQGHEAGPADRLWLGVSVIAPGGHTDLRGSGVEKHYVVVKGEVTMRAQMPGGPVEEQVLREMDSVRIAPGEARQIVNRSNEPATVLLAMPLA